MTMAKRRNSPTPPRRSAPTPPAHRAWRVWLQSLATDAEAVTAAAHLYGELPPDARNAWLDALEEDMHALNVPEVAVYGPLLAVERDPIRLERIRERAGKSLGPVTRVRRALLGTASGGVRLSVLVIPLYLDFQRVLVSRFVKDWGFEWVKQDPFVPDGDAPVAGSTIEGVKLYQSSTEAVVDELAHAVLAHRRRGLEVPEVLKHCADLFSARNVG